MKTLSKLFAVAVVFLGLGISSSYARTTSEIITNEKKDFQVAFLSQNIDQMVVSFESSGDPVQINFLDNNGKTVHQEAISGNGIFTKRYDLSELDNGIYSFQVKKGQDSFTKTVVLK
jgi:hypothetical protein